jgi:alpha-tubulin suppressor-like RCC1 family protein
MIESGLSNSIAIKQNGAAWCWGDNTYGQNGNNTVTSYSSPIAVVGAHSFLYVSSGARNCFGTKADGTCWAWGNNQTAGLGDGTLTNRSSPVQIVGNHSFLIIKGGGNTTNNFTGGLKADGTLWMWGINAFGQLGDNSVTQRTSPVAVVGAHSFIDFCCGGFSTFGLKANGQVWVWGCNSYGELGTNNRTSFSSPVQVVGAHSFITIAASVNSSTAGLKITGGVWTWGNGTGVGNGTAATTSYSSPVLVIGSHSFGQLRSQGGPAFVCLKGDGSAWTWGDNNFGRLGDNSLTARTSPVAVVGSHSFLTIQTGLDINLCISSAWIKKPIMWFKVAGVWERVGETLVVASAAWKHPARELR